MNDKQKDKLEELAKIVLADHCAVIALAQIVLFLVQCSAAEGGSSLAGLQSYINVLQEYMRESLFDAKEMREYFGVV